MKLETIKQTINFKNIASIELYNLFMNDSKHASFTGDKVIMSNEINGNFEIFGGYCKGYNIELDKGKKIVQAWHFDEDGWPENHYSICTFTFEKTIDGTKLAFLQTQVPEHKVEALKTGCKNYYWQAIKNLLNNKLSTKS